MRHKISCIIFGPGLREEHLIVLNLLPGHSLGVQDNG